MNEKDSIEELFRNAGEENSHQDKPRDIVWKKIETELHQNKTKKPLKDFLQSVWSSAAVFALIALPYFYFLIENMNKDEKTLEIVKENVDQLLEKVPVIVQQTKHPSIIEPEVEIVKNLPPVVVQKSENPSIIMHPKFPSTEVEVMKTSVLEDELELKNSLNDSTQSMIAARMSDGLKSEKKNNDTIGTVAIASAKVDVKETEKSTLNAPSAAVAKTPQKTLDPIVFNRNRIILQTKVDRVSLNYVKKQNNKVIFEKDGKRFIITRKNGLVEVSVNNDKLKKDLLQILIKNKENIFNYYINIPAPK